MTNCPTCGRPLPRADYRTADELVARMRSARPEGVDCYEGQDGKFYLTYVGGVAEKTAVDEAIRLGLIRQKYSSVAGYYTVGKTIDCEATLAARAKHGRRAPLIYLEA